ncbi:MAG: ferric reductase-like transmembrane domain-containing protein [Magnetococcales bacterium]|nr:ferric reductase-like transmembrane domain-containing protein [Magnetococcales bacterium]
MTPPHEATIRAKSRTDRNNTLYLLSSLSTLIIALAVGLQPLYLDDALLIPYEESGVINSHLVVVTEIISLLTIGYIEFIQKRIGNGVLLFLGFLLAGIGASLAPLSHETHAALGLNGLVFYYLMRILISLGANTAQLEISTLIGRSSISDRSPGMMLNTIIMLVLGGSVIFAILMQIPHDAGTVYSVMILMALISIAGAWIIKQKLIPHQPQEWTAHPSGGDDALTLIARDPRLQLSLAATFFVRADMIVLSLFLSMWHISIADLVGVSRVYATAHAAALIGMVGMVLLISIPVWKQFMEAHSRVTAIGASLCISGVGFLLMSLVVNPFDWSICVPLAIIGFGAAGSLTAPKILTLELFPAPLLSAVQGIFSLVGSLGVIVLVQSGGYFFDAVGPRSPFVLIGTGNFLLLIYAVWLIHGSMTENAQHVLLAKGRNRLDLKPLIWMLSTLPILWLLGRVLLSGYVPGSSVGQMPVGFINRYLGDWAFNFLLISLSLRPISELTGIKQFGQYRRMIGLYAFFYATLHVVTFVWLEWNLKWNDIVADVYKREFTLLGLAAYALLIVLAATSTHNAIRKLGIKRWKQIHQMTFIINILVAFHFIFASTHDNGEPYVYLILVMLLLWYRFQHYLNGSPHTVRRKDHTSARP